MHSLLERPSLREAPSHFETPSLLEMLSLLETPSLIEQSIQFSICLSNSLNPTVPTTTRNVSLLSVRCRRPTHASVGKSLTNMLALCVMLYFSDVFCYQWRGAHFLGISNNNVDAFCCCPPWRSKLGLWPRGLGLVLETTAKWLNLVRCWLSSAVWAGVWPVCSLDLFRACLHRLSAFNNGGKQAILTLGSAHTNGEIIGFQKYLHDWLNFKLP